MAISGQLGVKADIVLALLLEMTVQLGLCQEPFLQKVFPNTFLKSPLLPEQHIKLKRAYQAVSKEDFTEPFPGPPALQQPGNVGFGKPSPSLSNFTDSGTLSSLPH